MPEWGEGPGPPVRTFDAVHGSDSAKGGDFLSDVVYLVTYRDPSGSRRVYEFAERKDAERILTELCFSGCYEVELFEARYLERL